MDPRRIATSAAKHHGVLLPDLLDREEVTARQRRLRVASGEWRRLDCGILVVSAVRETFEMLATAALAAVPTGALGHQSSMRIHTGEVFDGLVHLTVPEGARTRCPGVVLHRTDLPTNDVVVRKGFRVTTLERTLVDLGATMGRRELQRCIEDHIVQGRTTFAHLRVDRRRTGPGRPLVPRCPGHRRTRRAEVPCPAGRVRTRPPPRPGRSPERDPNDPLHAPPDRRRAGLGRACPAGSPDQQRCQIRAGCDVTRHIRHGSRRPLAVLIGPWQY